MCMSTINKTLISYDRILNTTHNILEEGYEFK